MGCGGSVPAEEYSPPRTGSTEDGAMVVLTRKGSYNQCVFEKHHTLSCGQEGQLTLSSHPGLAIVPRYDYPRSAEEWRYIEIGIGPAHMAMSVRFESNFLVRVHDERVMDISHWQYEEGNTLNVLRSGKNHPAHTRASGGGRSFIFNPDGTISPQHAQHLVLGVGIPDCTLVNINSPNKAILASAHELRGGGSVALTLSSHPGYAIVPKFVPRRINEWHVSYAHWGIGPAADAATARLEGNHVISTQPATNDFILDVPFGKLNEGCDGIPVAMICFDNRSQNREPHNAARLFQVNSDGSISPSRAPHLALGLRQGDRLMPVANAPGLASFSVAAQPMSMPVVAAQPVVVEAAAVASPVMIPMGTAVEASAVEASALDPSAPQTLEQITSLLRRELNLDPSANMKDTVEQACEQLGIDVPKSEGLMAKARACQQALTGR